MAIQLYHKPKAGYRSQAEKENSLLLLFKFLPISAILSLVITLFRAVIIYSKNNPKN